VQSRHPRLAVAACLLAVLATQQWAWLLGLFLFATAEGSHRTLVTEGAAGLSVVLRHEARGAVPVRGHDRSFGHEHCLSARLLTLLAADRTSQTDHVIQFAAAAPHLSNPSVAVPLLPIGLIFAPVLTSASLPFLPPQKSPSLQPRPPPVLAALLLQVRSTVLLV